MHRRLAFAAFAVPLALALGLVSCGGEPDGNDGIATAGNGAAAKPSTSASLVPTDSADRRLEFARCMRDNGVEIPDPGPDDGGGLRLRLNRDIDPAKVEAAMEKCRRFLPNGGEPPNLSPEQQEKLREYARCMRDNGVTGFPDPAADGGFRLNRDTLKINPDDPAFKAAEEKCRQHRPQLRPGGNA